MDNDTALIISTITRLLLLLVFILPLSMWGCPRYSVYQQKLEGEAELAKATYSRQVKVREAEAIKESAVLLAQADVSRAEGVAKANKIIGDSLRDNESYLRWLYIEGLKEKTNMETIYVPTEAGLPILEAGRRVKSLEKQTKK